MCTCIILTVKLDPIVTKSWLIGKDLDAGKDWRQKEKGAAEDDTVASLNESQQTLGYNEGQGSLACCSSWGWKKAKSDMGLTDWTITYSNTSRLKNNPFMFSCTPCSSFPQETHRIYKQKLEELNALQTSCSSSINKQKTRLKDLKLTLQR